MVSISDALARGLVGSEDAARLFDCLPIVHRVSRKGVQPFLIMEDDIAELELPAERLPPHLCKKTCMYLMQNTRNGYVKIGNSENPRFREATLQSEEPEIELIKFWPCIAAHEQSWHERYHHKRLRGEWFLLSYSDIKHIIEVMDMLIETRPE